MSSVCNVWLCEVPPNLSKQQNKLPWLPGFFFLERGANLESRAAHTHPKNTQVPPPALGACTDVINWWVNPSSLLLLLLLLFLCIFCAGKSVEISSYCSLKVSLVYRCLILINWFWPIRAHAWFHLFYKPATLKARTKSKSITSIFP